MERKNKIVLLLLLAVLILAGCKSSKTASVATKATEVEQIKKLPAVSDSLAGISARMKLSANINGKSISSAGSIKVKKGGGVRLSITPLGLFEAARVEFLPQSAQYINRLDNEYSQMNYSSVAALQELGLSYSLLESVLLNAIYIPSGMSMNEALAGATLSSGQGAILIVNKMKDVLYEHHIDAATGLLIKSVGIYKNGTSVSCVYDNFQQVGNRSFPASIELALGGSGNPVRLSFSLSKIKENNDFTPTTPPASYKRVAPSSLLKLLGGK